MLSLLHTYLIMASKWSNIGQEQGVYIKFRSFLKDTNRNIHIDLANVCGDEGLYYSWKEETTEDRPRAGRPLSTVGEE